jgi:hypothetical protein
MPIIEREVATSKEFFYPRKDGEISNAEKRAFFDDARALAIKIVTTKGNSALFNREALNLVLGTLGPIDETRKVLSGESKFVEDDSKIDEEVEKLKPARK